MTRTARIVLAILMTMPAWAVGTVNQSLAQIPGSTNYVFTENWTGDAITGSVPSTLMLGAVAIQGFRIVSIETAPGSPAPTNNYSVTLTDFSSADILGGAGTSQSNSTATVLPSLSNAPPIYGSLTVNVTGNSVASAKGSIFIYFAPVSQVIGNTPAGASLTANNLLTGANTLNGATTINGTLTTTNANTFQGANTLSGPSTFTGSNTFNTTTFSTSRLNNAVAVDGVKYPLTRAGIQSAINDAGSNNVVILPANVNITLDGTPITVTNSNVAIVGGSTGNSGVASTILTVPASNGDVFQITGTLFTIRNIQIGMATLAGTRTGAVFNLTTFNQQGIFENMRFVGDPTFNAGDIFFSSRTSAGGGFITYVGITIFNDWNSAWNFGTTTGTLASQHASRVITSCGANFALAEVLLDSGIDTFVMDNSELKNGSSGSGNGYDIWVRNTLGGAVPRWIIFDHDFLESNNSCGANNFFGTAIQLDSSNVFKFLDGYIATVTTGVVIGAAATDTNLSNNIFKNVQQTAITINAAAIGTLISGNGFQDIGVQTNNTFDIISVAANTNDFLIANNYTTKLAANAARNGVTISGTSTNWRVVNNTFVNETGTAAISDTSSGANKVILGNQSFPNVAIGASGGFTFVNAQINEAAAPGGVVGAEVCYGDNVAHVLKCNYNNTGALQETQTVGSGTATMTTALIASQACGTVVTVAQAGVATTDSIFWNDNAQPAAATNGVLTIKAWPTSGNVNFFYCNPTAAGVTPAAATLNWRVTR